MITSLIAGYEVNHVEVTRYELHDRTFRYLTTIPFIYLIQQLRDEARVPEIYDFNRSLEVRSVANMSMIKDLTTQSLPRDLVHLRW